MRPAAPHRITDPHIAVANSTTAVAGVQCQPLSFLCYRDVFGGWRWEFREAHGDFVDSQESYESQEECIAAVNAAMAERVSSTAR
jgi:uncharacterized protein YegP (UPF0339 family)